MNKLLVTALLFTTACFKLPEDINEVGPEITVVLDPTNSSIIRDTDTAPSMTIDTAMTMYAFTFEVQTTDAEKDSAGATAESFPVTAVNATFTVPGATVPAGTYRIGSGSNPTFTRNELITLPTSVQNQMLKITVTATAAGSELASNAIDFNVAMR